MSLTNLVLVVVLVALFLIFSRQVGRRERGDVQQYHLTVTPARQYQLISQVVPHFPGPMGVTEEREQGLGAVPRVPEPGGAVVPARCHVVLSVGAEVEVAYGLCVCAVDDGCALHRPEIVQTNVLV